MTLNGVMALFCVISANSGSFRAHCVKVHVRYLISWWVLVLIYWKVKVKLGKLVTAHCGKIQTVTTLYRFPCGVVKVCVVPSAV